MHKIRTRTKKKEEMKTTHTCVREKWSWKISFYQGWDLWTNQM